MNDNKSQNSLDDLIRILKNADSLKPHMCAIGQIIYSFIHKKTLEEFNVLKTIHSLLGQHMSPLCPLKWDAVSEKANLDAFQLVSDGIRLYKDETKIKLIEEELRR